jgi:SAM-dependent methyltransferase
MGARPRGIGVLAPDGLWLGSWARFFLGNRLAPFVGSSLPVCQAMLRLAKVGAGDRFVDLGCGDGRLLVLATRDFGAERAVGYETDAGLAALARKSAEAEGLSGRVDVRQQDARSADLSDCTVVTLYLSTGGNTQLLPVLATLPPSARVVSFHWPIEGAHPVSTLDQSGTKLYLFNASEFQTGAGSRSES